MNFLHLLKDKIQEQTSLKIREILKPPTSITFSVFVNHKINKFHILQRWRNHLNWGGGGAKAVTSFLLPTAQIVWPGEQPDFS